MIEKTLPNRYKHLLSEQDYSMLLDMSLAYLKDKLTVINVKDGIITARKEDNKTLQCALGNLVRLCAQEDTEEWFEMVCTHFEKIMDIDYKPNLESFESAKDLLGMRVYPEDFTESSEFKAKLISRVDFEGTLTTLVLDLPDKFQTLTIDDVEAWNKTAEDLFSIAQANINKKDVEINHHRLAEEFDLYTFFSGDYSVSYILDFEANAQFALGKFGSLVAIPAKGSVFTHPIEGTEVISVMEILQPLVIKFYDEEPGNISYNYFWYYKGTFHLFPLIRKDGKATLQLPEQLVLLLTR